VPAATYKDLCIDAVDARLLGEFWARALDLQLHLLDDGDARLTGPTPQHTVWINTVPEPVTVKQRVHIDVYAGSVDDVLALGATPDDLVSFPWKVLRDPEGGELCVFERDEVPQERLMEIVVDCAEGEEGELADWWADVLGGRRRDDQDGRFSWVEDIPGAPFESLVLVPVPEPKTVKNRVHLDVTTDDVAALTTRGARVLRERDDRVRWTVMADPAGNEFCAFTD
jgi:hypothetical protein